MGLGVNLQQRNEDIWPVLHHAAACSPSSARHQPLIKAVNPHWEGFSSCCFPGYTNPHLNFSILHPLRAPPSKSHYLTAHKHPETISPHQPCLSQCPKTSPTSLASFQALELHTEIGIYVR